MLLHGVVSSLFTICAVCYFILCKYSKIYLSDSAIDEDLESFVVAAALVYSRGASVHISVGHGFRVGFLGFRMLYIQN